MEIITDLHKIASLAKARNDENWRFRAYIKNLDMDIEELDKIVHKINKDVSSQIDCTKCSNCCRKSIPVLDDKNIVQFSNGLNMEVSVFKEQYIIQDEEEEEGKYNFNSLPCPFLKEGICTNYNNRPKDCQSYPHLHKDEFVFRLWNVIDQYEICPIVFNVYEILKEKLWNKRFSFYEDEIDLIDY
ncbi:MAG: YkgJ family cysteine cluster protein [Tissierellales bacterium]|nr:YkgJ family cysteine cluster protein [Tissierellales bacterium]